MVFLLLYFYCNAQKYAVYTDSLTAAKRDIELTKNCKPYWQVKKLPNTNYSNVVKIGQIYCLPIISGYEQFFTKKEIDTAITN